MKQALVFHQPLRERVLPGPTLRYLDGDGQMRREKGTLKFPRGTMPWWIPALLQTLVPKPIALSARVALVLAVLVVGALAVALVSSTTRFPSPRAVYLRLSSGNVGGLRLLRRGPQLLHRHSGQVLKGGLLMEGPQQHRRPSRT